MSNEEQAFIAAIAAAPDDEAPHKIYADWLDEHDRPEDAAYHRRWSIDVRKAEDWLKSLAERYGLFDEYPRCIQKIVEEQYCHGNRGDSLSDDLRSDSDLRADLYENWHIATGAKISFRAVAGSEYFSCGC